MKKLFDFSHFRGDLFGGITAGIVALPLALAFGLQSGLGAAAGLYGAIFISFFAALFGGTNTQISGPTAPMTAVSAETVSMEIDQIPQPQQAVIDESARTPLPKLAIDINDRDWQTRIETRDLEYRQQLTEYYDRIKSREYERLEEYKKHQNEHIDFLIEQITRQEQIIEKLILRNQEYYDRREASMQRRHLRREEMLNRI